MSCRRTSSHWRLPNNSAPTASAQKQFGLTQNHAKGYFQEDFLDILPRYIPRSEVEALRAEWSHPSRPPENEDPPRS